jgi:hypothetical protein
MRKILILVVVCLSLVLSACSGTSQEEASPQAATPTPTATPEVLPAGLPGGSDEGEPKGTETEEPAPTPYKSKLYDPSIFVIEAKGTHQQELAPGYYANYECEIYLHKIDQNDNRVTTGDYQGVFWMNVILDADDFIKDMIGDAPIQIDFGVGGEVVCDTLGIYLNTTDDKAWTNYSIPDENGKPHSLTQDSPVGKGSFAAVSKYVYLEAHAAGAQGERIDYSDASAGDLIDINYVINVEPDAAEANARRKVIINLSGEGFSFNIEGVLKRLPGYREDVEDYYDSDGYKNSTWSRLQEP